MPRYEWNGYFASGANFNMFQIKFLEDCIFKRAFIPN